MPISDQNEIHKEPMPLHINGSKFIQNINKGNENILKEVAQRLPRSHDAAFNAAINLDNLARRQCTMGTRVDIIAQIMAWVEETDPVKAPPVYWLTGLAGLGKTTIAYTICERLNEAHLPFSSFFCSLQLDSRNSKLLVTTLCRDLAEVYNSYTANVLSVLETNSKVVNAGLRIQIDELLVKPLQCFVHITHSSYPGMALQLSHSRNVNLGPPGIDVIPLSRLGDWFYTFYGVYSTCHLQSPLGVFR